MAESLTTKTVEGAEGVMWALPFHDDGSSRYYPLVQLAPTELGGLSVYSAVMAASTNATSVKTSAGQLYGYHVYNEDDSPVCLRFYDLATAPTVGTSTIKMRFGIPLGAADNDGCATSEFWSMGIPFSTGIAFAVTAAIEDSDTTAIAADDVLLTLYYK